ncbi:DEAD/DEAH box helicase [Nocardioides panzhihuensis]
MTDPNYDPLSIAKDVRSWAKRTVGHLDRLVSEVNKAEAEARKSSIVVPFPEREGAILGGTVAVPGPAAGKPVDAMWKAVDHYARLRDSAGLFTIDVGVLTCELRALVTATKPRRRLFRQLPPDPAVVDRLLELRDWAVKTGYDQALAGVAEGRLTAEPSLSERVNALASVLGVAAPEGTPGRVDAEDSELVHTALRLHAQIDAHHERLREEVREAYAKAQDRKLDIELARLPLDALKAVSDGGLRLGTLESAGIDNVGEVLRMGGSIAQLPGISEDGARMILAAAGRLRRAAAENLGHRIDAKPEDPLLTSLVRALATARAFEDDLSEHRGRLSELADAVADWGTVPAWDGEVLLLHRSSPRRGADLATWVKNWADWAGNTGLAKLLSRTESVISVEEAWATYSRQAVEFYGSLAEIAGIPVDEQGAQGHLPDQIVEAVNSLHLDKAQLAVSLRGYQDFGARFALMQRRVILGDEMGLGKTVQAIAAMAHLAASGANHFVVVCPPAVVFNWVKEIRAHSRLAAFRIHGPDRDAELRRWRQQGGVAVVSFGISNGIDLGGLDPAMLVVDEAHYVKNPEAKRSQAVARHAQRSDRVLFLSGTPMENRLSEFHALVSHLQPDVLGDIDPAAAAVGGKQFRAAVAPVYLRRKSEDVLAELPELIQTEEWTDLTAVETDAYLDALNASDFAALRRIALTADPDSSKLARLEEIVDEALGGGRKVLVFSYFREALAAILDRLGDRAIGVINGSVPVAAREKLCEEFNSSLRPKVLIGQIEAMGTGLNLQAASVVVLCEPQVKPTIEAQAIKRAHRMGQVENVSVYRLLTTESVDERMLALLDLKRRVFDEYVDESAVATVSPDAVDATDADLAKQVLAQEQNRLIEQLRARAAAQRAASTPQPESPAAGPTDAKSSRVETCPSCDRRVDPMSGRCACS